MARSEYVYVVIDPAGGAPAPFTVKHELVTWLSRHPNMERLLIWRCRDGLHKTNSKCPALIHLAELGLDPRPAEGPS